LFTFLFWFLFLPSAIYLTDAKNNPKRLRELSEYLRSKLKT